MMPSGWVLEASVLPSMRWSQGEGASYASALMCYAVIVQHADMDTGVASVTYDTFAAATGRGRELVSKGLQHLYRFGLIDKPGGRSLYHMVDYSRDQGWAMFPHRQLYTGDRIPFFSEMHLRKRADLDALKLLYTFTAFRSREDNRAHVSYKRIAELTGVSDKNISAAVSLLTSGHVINVDQVTNEHSSHAFHHAYRLRGIEPRRHRGTSQRASI